MTNPEQYNEIGREYTEQISELTSLVLREKDRIHDNYDFQEGEGNIRIVSDTLLLGSRDLKKYVGITLDGEWVNEAGTYAIRENPLPTELLSDFAVITDSHAREIFVSGWKYTDELDGKIRSGYLPPIKSARAAEAIADNITDILNQYVNQNRLRLMGSFYDRILNFGRG